MTATEPKPRYGKTVSNGNKNAAPYVLSSLQGSFSETELSRPVTFKYCSTYLHLTSPRPKINKDIFVIRSKGDGCGKALSEVVAVRLLVRIQLWHSLFEKRCPSWVDVIFAGSQFFYGVLELIRPCCIPESTA